MGLDGVELIVEVENTFEISILDHEAEKIVTVGDLHNVVWKHIENKASESCLTRSLFYRLRSLFGAMFNISNQDFHPNRQLSQIIPQTNRRANWEQLQQESGLKFPKLVLTKFWSQVLFSFGILSILGSAVISFTYWRLTIKAALPPTIGIALTCFLSSILTPKRTEFDPGTVRGFVQQALALNYKHLNKDVSISRKEAESIINHIISYCLAIDLEEITSEKSFVKDLGID